MKRLRVRLSKSSLRSVSPIITLGGLLLLCLWLVKLLYFPTLGTVGKPIATLDKTFENLGDISIDADGTATFMLTNTGSAPLKIGDIQATCNCIFVTVTIGGVSTGKFTHPSYTKQSLSGWSAELSPKQSASLEVLFSPDDYIVYGPVIRQATLTTNDPDNPKVVLELRANVLTK